MSRKEVKEAKKNQKRGFGVSDALMVFFAAVFLFSATMFTAETVRRSRDAKAFQAMAAGISDHDEGGHIDEMTDEQLRAMKYRILKKDNPDLCGWIRVDGIAIDFPVMFTPDRKWYYLEHSFSGERSTYGVPFVDEKCDPENDNNVIIYGHNIRNGAMFAPLLKYQQKSFWQNHKTIKFDTLDVFGEYEILGTFNFDTLEDSFPLIDYVGMDEEDFGEYMKYVNKNKLYSTGAEAEFGDNLITIITCNRNAFAHEQGRFVIVAKRVSEIDLRTQAEEPNAAADMMPEADTAA